MCLLIRQLLTISYYLLHFFERADTCQYSGVARDYEWGVDPSARGAEWGGVWRGVSPSQPTRGPGERRELSQWGPGEALAANAFSAYSRPQNASRRKKNVKYISDVSDASK